MGWPIDDKRDEMWKYTDVRPVARTEFRLPNAPAVIPSSAEIAAMFPFDEGMSRLVFIDGYYSPDASRIVDADNGSILRITEAVREEETLVHGHLARYSEPGHDASVGLNTAFFRDGAFIHAVAAVAGGVVGGEEAARLVDRGGIAVRRLRIHRHHLGPGR